MLLKIDIYRDHFKLVELEKVNDVQDINRLLAKMMEHSTVNNSSLHSDDDFRSGNSPSQDYTHPEDHRLKL